MAADAPTILICFDGSEDATAAITLGGRLLQGARAVVLSVWDPFEAIAVRVPMAFGTAPGLPDLEEIDRASAESAQARAQQGAALARTAGLDAEARTCPRVHSTIATILAEAARLDADAILIGSRGHAAVRSLILGSVSQGVVHGADRPVIVVPSPSVASARARTIAAAAGAAGAAGATGATGA